MSAIFDAIDSKNYDKLINLCQTKKHLINKYNLEGSLPLLHAILKKDFQSAEILINFKANVNKKHKKSGLSPLHAVLNFETLAEDDEDAEFVIAMIIEFLLFSGANVNEVDKNGRSPIIIICSKEEDYPMILNALLDKNPKLELVDSETYTALTHAIMMDNYSCCMSLIKAGANVNHIFYDTSTCDDKIYYNPWCIFHQIIANAPFEVFSESLKTGDVNLYIKDHCDLIGSIEASTRQNWRSKHQLPDRTEILLKKIKDYTKLHNAFKEAVERSSFECARVILEHLFDKGMVDIIKKCEKHINIDCVNLIPASKYSNRWSDEINAMLSKHLKIIECNSNTIPIKVGTCKVCPLCRGRSWRLGIVNIKEKCCVCLDESEKMVKYECEHTPCCIKCYSFI